MTVAIHLFLEIMFKFSFPQILHSDNRIEFKSKLIANLSQQLSIKKTFISPNTPRQTENSNHHIDSLKTALRNSPQTVLSNGMNYFHMQLLHSTGSQTITHRNPPFYTLDETHTYLTLQPFYSQNLDTSAQTKM